MSSNESNPLKRISRRAEERVPVDRIEQIWEGARDAQDLIRDKKRREQRSLLDYTGDDEITARHDNQQRIIIENHVHQHSQPEVEVETSVEVGPLKAKGAPRWAVGVVVIVGTIIALGTALIAQLLAR